MSKLKCAEQKHYDKSIICGDRIRHIPSGRIGIVTWAQQSRVSVEFKDNGEELHAEPAKNFERVK